MYWFWGRQPDIQNLVCFPFTHCFLFSLCFLWYMNFVSADKTESKKYIEWFWAFVLLELKARIVSPFQCHQQWGPWFDFLYRPIPSKSDNWRACDSAEVSGLLLAGWCGFITLVLFTACVNLCQVMVFYNFPNSLVNHVNIDPWNDIGSHKGFDKQTYRLISWKYLITVVPNVLSVASKQDKQIKKKNKQTKQNRGKKSTGS